MSHQVTIGPELTIMNWVLSDPLSHKVRCAQKHSIIKWEWFMWDWTPAGPEDTHVLLEEVAQMSIVSIPEQYFLFPSLHLWPYGDFPMISDGERENSGLAYRCFCTVCKHHPKMHSYSTTNHFGDIPERQWGREILLVDRISGTPCCSICLEEEMVTVWVYLDSWTVANCLAAFSWTWKEYNGKWMTRKIWEKDMCV